jgi:hypothetical protein
MAHCRGAKARYRKSICEAVPINCISKALQNGYVDSLIHDLSLGKKLVMHQILRVKESDHHRRWTCGHFYIGNTTQKSWTDSTLFLRMLVVAFRTFLWPSYQVFGRTWCTHVAPSTHPFHNTAEWQTRLHCRSTHSRLSQVAIRSSSMWRQEMLPSILYGCHFDNFCTFSIKNFVPDIYQTSYGYELCNVHHTYNKYNLHLTVELVYSLVLKLHA